MIVKTKHLPNNGIQAHVEPVVNAKIINSRPKLTLKLRFKPATNRIDQCGFRNRANPPTVKLREPESGANLVVSFLPPGPFSDRCRLR